MKITTRILALVLCLALTCGALADGSVCLSIGNPYIISGDERIDFGDIGIELNESKTSEFLQTLVRFWSDENDAVVGIQLDSGRLYVTADEFNNVYTVSYADVARLALSYALNVLSSFGLDGLIEMFDISSIDIDSLFGNIDVAGLAETAISGFNSVKENQIDARSIIYIAFTLLAMDITDETPTKEIDGVEYYYINSVLTWENIVPYVEQLLSLIPQRFMDIALAYVLPQDDETETEYSLTDLLGVLFSGFGISMEKYIGVNSEYVIINVINGETTLGTIALAITPDDTTSNLCLETTVNVLDAYSLALELYTEQSGYDDLLDLTVEQNGSLGVRILVGKGADETQTYTDAYVCAYTDEAELAIVNAGYSLTTEGVRSFTVQLDAPYGSAAIGYTGTVTSAEGNFDEQGEIQIAYANETTSFTMGAATEMGYYVRTAESLVDEETPVMDVLLDTDGLSEFLTDTSAFANNVVDMFAQNQAIAAMFGMTEEQ